jgi:hypothetical protein
MVYQFDRNSSLVATHKSFSEAQSATSIPIRTIRSACERGGLCNKKYYFSSSPVMVKGARKKGEVPGKKFTVVVTKEIWDTLLVTIGQRNKQDIFRKILQDWIKNEKEYIN